MCEVKSGFQPIEKFDRSNANSKGDHSLAAVIPFLVLETSQIIVPLADIAKAK